MSDSQRRKSLLAAHSVALHVQVVAPVPPSSVTIMCHAFSPTEPSVDINFHVDRDGVQQLAEVLGVGTTTRQHSTTDPQLYTVATAEIAGIPVKIWTLMDPLEVSV
ncbi:hypothetical protein C9F11_37680 [Streptomyces sp. YIM 121038]|uniref:hypothetical protein n=1 Tax=Streptomyces sp. YIM 121038 TaxID=2136401 RepID=UPI00111032B0|nr:hypothetical protein [Streptomyces sp. YIM 121038]QCX81119.1 hypothetical protein C9F11_37680 [Streptomyces sp. YIM 121038]